MFNWVNKEGLDVQEIKTKIDELELLLLEIQEQCSHPKHCLTIKSMGSTGNYDPSANRYWTEFHCHLCDKHWSEDQ